MYATMHGLELGDIDKIGAFREIPARGDRVHPIGPRGRTLP